MPLQRSSDMQLRGGFKSGPFNTELDRLWQAMQGLKTRIERSVGLSRASTDNPLVLRTYAANTVLAISADGNFIDTGPTITEVSGANASAIAAAASAVQAELFDGPKFDTTTLASAYTEFTADQTSVVWAGFNGEPEAFKFVSDSTLTADGALVLASAMATGRLVSTRTEFATVAAMLADVRTYDFLVAGTSLQASGFDYTVAASGATDQHVTTAGGVKLYVRSSGEAFNAKAFGAVGDGVADDTVPMQAAINASTAFPQTALFVPNGRYLITATLLVGNTGRLYMYGEGKTFTRFTFTSVNSPGIEWTVSGTYSKLSKFRMTGPGLVLGNTAIGIKTFRGVGSSSIFMLFEDLWLQHWPMWAMELTDSYNCKLVDSFILENGVRSTLAGGGTDGQGGGVHLERVNFTGAASTGNDWTNCYFKTNNIGVQVKPGGADQKIINTRFDMCIFEFNYVGLDLRNTGTGSASRFVFLNTCYLENNLFAGFLGDDGTSIACWQNLQTPGTGTPPSVSTDGADGIVWTGRYVHDSPGNFTVGSNGCTEPSKRETLRIQKISTNPRIDRLIVQRETGIVMASTVARTAEDEVRILSGAGNPEGYVSAQEGSIFLRRTGGASTCFYVKESGDTGNTGWVAK